MIGLTNANIFLMDKYISVKILVSGLHSNSLSYIRVGKAFGLSLDGVSKFFKKPTLETAQMEIFIYNKTEK